MQQWITRVEKTVTKPCQGKSSSRNGMRSSRINNDHYDMIARDYKSKTSISG